MSAPTTGDDWESSLWQAFGVLLDHPLSGFDAEAEYAACYSGNWLAETGFNTDPAWLEPAALAGRATISNENLLLLDEVGYPELRFDPSRSLFEIDAAAPFPAGFRDELVAVKPAGSDRWPQVGGTELARLTARHGVGLPAGSWSVTSAAIASDGTLLDALRVATGMGDGFDSLVPYEGDDDPETAAAVAAVEHAGVRAHLRAFCDPRSDELALCREDMRRARNEGGALVARWEGAVDQYEITVRRVGR
ncbi:hypothetical protein [Nonomuraea sp. NPDC049624]|uniref:hypothetical protein n=1 Tax=Nonomuraea sp. NPDC049624 TaxID=3154354 RepID=UPI00342EECA0